MLYLYCGTQVNPSNNKNCHPRSCFFSYPRETNFWIASSTPLSGHPTCKAAERLSTGSIILHRQHRFNRKLKIMHHLGPRYLQHSNLMSNVLIATEVVTHCACKWKENGSCESGIQQRCEAIHTCRHFPTPLTINFQSSSLCPISASSSYSS